MTLQHKFLLGFREKERQNTNNPAMSESPSYQLRSGTFYRTALVAQWLILFGGCPERNSNL